MKCWRGLRALGKWGLARGPPRDSIGYCLPRPAALTQLGDLDQPRSLGSIIQAPSGRQSRGHLPVGPATQKPKKSPYSPFTFTPRKPMWAGPARCSRGYDL